MSAKKKASPKETEEKHNALFNASLELTAIYHDRVRYRVVQPEGVALIDFHHIEMERKRAPKEDVFPRDDDFSFDFLNADLRAALPYTEDEASRWSETEKAGAEKALEAMKKKQTEFRRFAKLHIVIE